MRDNWPANADSYRGDDLDRPDERDLRIRELEERLSRLSEAGLRITEDLDFNTVLQGVVDSARSLTSSRYGAITVFGDGGQPSGRRKGSWSR